jgi:hypothetical protein
VRFWLDLAVVVGMTMARVVPVRITIGVAAEIVTRGKIDETKTRMVLTLGVGVIRNLALNVRGTETSKRDVGVYPMLAMFPETAAVEVVTAPLVPVVVIEGRAGKMCFEVSPF